MGPRTATGILCSHNLGNHLAASATVGVLGRRGFALESSAVHVCREAGGCVMVNAFLKDSNIVAPHAADNRRLEVVVNALPLFHGAQLAIDTTMVSPREGWGATPPRRLQCCCVVGSSTPETTSVP